MTIQPNIHINIQLKIVVKLCIKPYKVASNCYCDFFFFADLIISIYIDWHHSVAIIDVENELETL